MPIAMATIAQLRKHRPLRLKLLNRDEARRIAANINSGDGDGRQGRQESWQRADGDAKRRGRIPFSQWAFTDSSRDGTTDASWVNRPTQKRPAALAHSIPPAPPRSLQNGGENSRQCREKLIGTVRSSCACGMLAGNAGSGSARLIISITSLSRLA